MTAALTEASIAGGPKLGVDMRSFSFVPKFRPVTAPVADDGSTAVTVNTTADDTLYRFGGTPPGTPTLTICMLLSMIL